ncbi:YeeE/YedE family protein [Methyloferula stellata]|uniref:YeeE/YedE family protein n=1 Tax=Methyloferula stellata TaxID=876270 RepID=UPI0003A4A11A|nr:YeeE/YedE family protein [Methyloferula stellata]
MPTILAALISGLIFGVGLVISQMINPAKVLNFLDVTGTWDPSLAFVMAGAIPVAALGFYLGRRRAAPVLAQSFHGPTQTKIDFRLIAGATLFGIGWGLIGFCPGPALAALQSGRHEVFIFVAAMIGGMVVFRLMEKADTA